jgi:hypothetical protein
MQVVFTRMNDKQYAVAIEREHGPALVPRLAPGYDDQMPHDLAHYLVEEQFGIRLGVFGQLAAGGGGIFAPARRDHTTRVDRSVRRIGQAGRADMQRSERLVYLCVSEWERRACRRMSLPSQVALGDATPEQLDAAVDRLGWVARQWQRLLAGSSLTFTWPKQLTVDPAGSQLGRRPYRRPGRRGHASSDRDPQRRARPLPDRGARGS